MHSVWKTHEVVASASLLVTRSYSVINFLCIYSTFHSDRFWRHLTSIQYSQIMLLPGTAWVGPPLGSVRKIDQSTYIHYLENSLFNPRAPVPHPSQKHLGWVGARKFHLYLLRMCLEPSYIYIYSKTHPGTPPNSPMPATDLASSSTPGPDALREPTAGGSAASAAGPMAFRERSRTPGPLGRALDGSGSVAEARGDGTPWVFKMMEDDGAWILKTGIAWKTNEHHPYQHRESVMTFAKRPDVNCLRQGV